MVNMKLGRIHDIKQFQTTFNRTLGYSNVPLEYFNEGCCWGLTDRGKILAGFCLVRGWEGLRAVRQMPLNVQKELRLRNPKLSLYTADFTGYFILSETPWAWAFIFSFYLVLVCWLHPVRYFIYSYAISETPLGKYYAAGHPQRVHTGKPEKLEGHKEEMEEEHVEILTKWGILRIFLYRTRRLITKLIFKRKK